MKRLAYSCVRKRRKFSEDARMPSGSHVMRGLLNPTSLSSGFLRPSNKEVAIQHHASFYVQPLEVLERKEPEEPTGE